MTSSISVLSNTIMYLTSSFSQTKFPLNLTFLSLYQKHQQFTIILVLLKISYLCNIKFSILNISKFTKAITKISLSAISQTHYCSLSLSMHNSAFSAKINFPLTLKFYLHFTLCQSAFSLSC